jgi:hypothetical protein
VTLTLRQIRRLCVPTGVGGHVGQDRQIHRRHPLQVGPADRLVARREAQAAAAGRDVHGELGGALAEARADLDHVGVDLPELVVVEQRVEQALPAGQALHRRQRVPAVRPQANLPVEHLPHQLQPGRRGPVVPERQRVEVHPEHLVGARHLGPRVADHAGVERRLAGELAEHLQVRGEQDRLERHPGAGGQGAQVAVEVLVGHTDPVAARRRLTPTRRYGPFRVPVDHTLPVGAVVGGVQCGQFRGDEVGVAHRRRLGPFRPFPARDPPVVPEDLHQQRVETPALGHEVRDAQHEPPRLVALHEDRDPQQRRPGQVERGGAFAGHVLAYRRLVRLAAQLHRDLRPGVDHLHRHREARVVDRGAQRLVPGDREPDRLAQFGQRERLGVGYPERVDDVVEMPSLLGHDLGQHPELGLHHRVRVDRVNGQQGAVLRGDQRERRHRFGRTGGSRPPGDVLGEGRHGLVGENVPDAGVEAGRAQRADQ